MCLVQAQTSRILAKYDTVRLYHTPESAARATALPHIQEIEAAENNGTRVALRPNNYTHVLHALASNVRLSSMHRAAGLARVPYMRY